MSNILDLIAKVSWETNEQDLKNVNKELQKEDKLLAELRRKGAQLENQMLQTNDTKQLKKYNNELQETRKQADKISESQKKQLDLTKKLKDEQKNLVAELKKTNDPNAVKGLLQNLYKVENQMTALTKKTSDFGSKFSGLGSSLLQGVGLGAGMFGATEIIGGVSNFLSGSLEEARDAERITGELQRALKTIGGQKYFDGLIDEAGELAGKFNNLFDNDEIVQSQTALVNYGKLTRAEMSKLIPTILELASAEKIDLATATEKVIGILEGRGGATLREYGLTVKGVKSEHDRLNLVLGEFDKKLKGSADAYAQTAEGIRRQNEIIIADTKEKIGTKLLPIYASFLQEVNGLLEGKLSDNIKRISTFFSPAGSGLRGAMDAEKELAKERETIVKNQQESLKKIEQTIFGLRKANASQVLIEQWKKIREDFIVEMQKGSKDTVLNPNAKLFSDEDVEKKTTAVKKKIENKVKADPINLDIKFRISEENEFEFLKNAQIEAERIAKEQADLINKRDAKFNTLDGNQILDEKQYTDAEAKELEAQINNRKKAEQEKTKITNEERIARVQTILDEVSNLANEATQVIAIEQEKNDKLIDLQNERIENAKKSSDVSLKIEQDRLQELLTRREKYERAQRAIDATVIVANQALAISNSLVAISSAVKSGNALLIGANIIAIIAGLTAGYSAVKSINAGFKEGGYTGDGDPNAESTQLGRKPYTYHKGEYVMDADLTSQHRDLFEGIHNRDLVVKNMKNGAYMIAPKGIDTDAMVNAHYIIKNDNNSAQLVYEIQSLKSEIGKIKMNVNNTFDAGGFGQSVATELVKANLVNKLRG